MSTPKNIITALYVKRTPCTIKIIMMKLALDAIELVLFLKTATAVIKEIAERKMLRVTDLSLISSFTKKKKRCRIIKLPKKIMKNFKLTFFSKNLSNPIYIKSVPLRIIIS
jgi:hypothetical protein